MNRQKLLGYLMKALIVKAALLTPSNLFGKEVAQKPKVAVFSFSYSWTNKNVEDEIAAYLERSGCVSAQREKLRDKIDGEKAVADAKKLGIDKVVVGNYSSTRETESITLRCIDVATGKVQYSGSIEGYRSASVTDTICQRLAEALCRK